MGYPIRLWGNTVSAEHGHRRSSTRRSSGEVHGRARVPELDGLRGLAIILVVVSHAFILPAVMGGVIGVTLFFVLSGYLITRLLLIEKDTHGRLSLTAFYGRRALRLFPALLVYLVGIAILLSVSGLNAPVWEVTWPPAFYVSNYAQILGQVVWPHRHTWSLAVEEHFYLVWPILVGLGATRSVKSLASAVALLLGWRFAVANFDLLWAYQGTDTNAYALGAGCLLATIRHGGVSLRMPRFTPLVVVTLLGLASFYPADGLAEFLEVAVWLAPAAALLSVFLISSVLDSPTPFLRARTLVWLGTVSYGLYLWHAPLLWLPPWSRTTGGRLLAVAMAIGLAAVSWRFIEEPILRSRLKRRLQRSQLSDPVGEPDIVIDIDALSRESSHRGLVAVDAVPETSEA